jgi:hypothetical protein
MKHGQQFFFPLLPLSATLLLYRIFVFASLAAIAGNV